LIEKFGGHAMAAGLSLRLIDLPRFQAAFERCATAMLSPDLLQDVILSDGAMPPEACDIDTALALRDGGPWGQGFAEPLFDDVFEVVGWKILGEQHLKLELVWPGIAPKRMNAIHFGGWTGEPPASRSRIAYRLQPDDWRGGDAVQLIVVHREPASA
jgi:single-stranded-DNA-specific exonuclease